jgi:allophanate hydrolase
MQALEVIEPGLSTTIQDFGRIGFRDVGVPASGPLDRISFRLANAVVGNHSSTTALETDVGSDTGVFVQSIRVALVGVTRV